MNKSAWFERRGLILLFFLSPFLGELLSGSSPPLEYFNPAGFILLHLLYGCGAVLVRELAVRWELKWGILLLAIAYGVVEEGLCCKSFFDPNWADLHKLSMYGYLCGTQWVWTVMLTAYHAVWSILIPILVAHTTFPELADRPWTGRRGFWALAGGVVAATAFGFALLPDPSRPFHPHTALTFGCLLAIAALGYTAYRTRFTSGPAGFGTRPFPRPWRLGVDGFLFTALNVIVPGALAGRHVPAWLTLLLQGCILGFFLKRGLAIFSGDARFTYRHRRALVLGCFAFWNLAAFVQPHGMRAVGVAAVALAATWWKKLDAIWSEPAAGQSHQK